MIQQTSLESYSYIQQQLGERQRTVYEKLKQIGEANNLMIANALGLSINQVTPRMLELRQLGMVVFSYTDSCPITKRRTIFWRVRC